MDLFTFIIMLLVGFLFLYLGWKIWKKEQITLIHDYHYTNVTEENKSAYTQNIGKALTLMGIGTLLTGVINVVTSTAYGWAVFAVCFVGGLIHMVMTQKKYNHGIF